MDLDLLTQIRTLSETNSQLRTEIQFANAQIVSLRQTVIEKERESSEFRKETEILRAESERTMGSCKAASFSPDQAAKSVEQQRTSTMQSLLSEFDPLTNDIPVRFPRSNWVSDFDEIDPLKVEIHELNARVRILEQLNETLTSRMEEDMMVEEELRQTIEELAEQNHLLVRLVPTNPAQLPDRATTQQESALYEALDSSVQPAWYEKKVVEEEEISESGKIIKLLRSDDYP
ncbi:hypothetical protein GHT06_011562 [Daphnia sinensis]|uniref:Uncharacterized protein n=1 Tax=Daphnia sinensis TaxID=1820382 RepID=A0AAD5LMN4_9CRUS|nr:hypothetical protein GHT06_011562 [Daphnia sinensis]